MLYKLNKDEIESSARIEIKTPSAFGLQEKDIEDFLRSRLSEVVSADHLMLIGQERSYQEEADLLALDKNGRLYIFELKRWEARSENLLQVMRYGQIFGRYTYEELEGLARRRQNLQGSLKTSHKDYFDLNEELSDSDFNKDQVFVLVTNGMDGDTISAVNYWSQKGVKIECAPYRIYEIGGEPYIQFDTYNPEDEVFPEENSKIFIVNTNKTYMPDAWQGMLIDGSTGSASAYYGRKYAVCGISKGDCVYLYHTGVGVIAKGEATSTYQITDCEGDPDETYCVPLKFEWALTDESEWNAKAPKAWEINSRLGAGHRFRQTVFGISQEMAEVIDGIFNERRLGTTQGT